MRLRAGHTSKASWLRGANGMYLVSPLLREHLPMRALSVLIVG